MKLLSVVVAVPPVLPNNIRSEDIGIHNYIKSKRKIDIGKTE